MSRFFALDSLSKKLLVPTLLLVTLSLAALGMAMIMQQNKVSRSMMESKATGTVDFVAKVSAPFLVNYDLSALENFVREIMRDADVAFAEFYDPSGRSLTAGVTKASQDVSGLIVFDREIRDSADKAIGKLKVGYRKTVLDEALRASVTIVITSVVVVLVLLALGLALIVRAIARPAAKILEGFTLLAQGEGDLTARIEVKTNDELGRMVAAFNMTMEKLHALISQVRDMAGSISVGAKQIASGNADLSQRTEEQASSLEETASSMEELTSTVKQNAENARQANQLAAGASDVAVRGGEVVSQVVQTMSSINDSSKKIVEIIGVIDGIAFQTNILALNAAVEAARAGEQGRGFAVVATEVRNLAQRSAAAAKEIKELIGSSVQKVDNGTRLVDQAGKTMEEVVSAVKRVSDIISEIAAASHEQSSGIEQVNQAVTQMDEVTQQNAAVVEEAAAAAESMQEQAQALAQAVAVFKLARSEARAPERPEKPVASVTGLPARKPAARVAVENKPAAARLRKVANAPPGDEEWQEF